MKQITCPHCGDTYPDFDVAHVCSKGPYAPKLKEKHMIETVVKSPLLPSTIHFNHTNLEGGIEASIPRGIEVMRITRDGVWVNPEIEVDEIAKSVLDALDYQIKMLVQSAVEEQRTWVGLTDEEIDAVLKSCNTTDTYKYFRAIEAKLKEKNT